ncbi:MAG: hypothetical protein K2L27_06780, partial [Muribaculaceae bacterium]|nr:hypothetical protein [Muribaculaceae bacterium]
AITDENNRLATPDIARGPLDDNHRVREEDEFIFQYEPTAEEEEEAEDLRHIDPATWGEDDDDDGFYPWDEDVESED